MGRHAAIAAMIVTKDPSVSCPISRARYTDLNVQVIP
jgi:hypothetical protein